tara:strand:+ start:114 stop:377 length:264 start_codon:yes stop_codon:yes gene_type:complete
MPGVYPGEQMPRLQGVLGPWHSARSIREALMPGPAKNIFTPQWFREFEQLCKEEKAQAASGKQQAARLKRQAASLKRQAKSDKSNKL